MVAIREKRVAYKHPNLCELQSKQETKFFLHPRVQLVWIVKAAWETDTGSWFTTAVQGSAEW